MYGFVYRVDMGLRAFDDRGALVVRVAALGDCYQHAGRYCEPYHVVNVGLMGDNS